MGSKPIVRSNRDKHADNIPARRGRWFLIIDEIVQRRTPETRGLSETVEFFGKKETHNMVLARVRDLLSLMPPLQFELHRAKVLFAVYNSVASSGQLVAVVIDAPLARTRRVGNKRRHIP